MPGIELLVKLQKMPLTLRPEFAWDRGHVVDVKPEGWAWGAAERLPKFFVLRITDMTVAQAEAYLEPDFDPETIDPLDPAKNIAPVHRSIRKWKFDADDVTIPTAIKNQIINTGLVSVTKAQVINFIKRIAVG
jgi:hypothetical protein